MTRSKFNGLNFVSEMVRIKFNITDELMKEISAEADLTERKAFLRSFIERIEVNGSEATIRYRLPLPQGGKTLDRVSVLPVDAPGGAEGIRTPDLLRAKEALSRLSYSPPRQNYSSRGSRAQSDATEWRPSLGCFQ